MFFSNLLEFFLNTFGEFWGIILFYLIPSIILSIPAWIVARKKHILSWLYFSFPICGILFWLIFWLIFWRKGQSWGNLVIEPFGVMSYTLLLLYSSVFFSSIKNYKQLSIISVIVLFLSIFIFKFFMPQISD